MPPSAQDAARRLLILVAISSHALRLMMLWDFTFRTAATMTYLTGEAPTWRSGGLRGEWLKLQTRWRWFWERRTIRNVLGTLGLSSSLTSEERELLRLGLSDAARKKACVFTWQIEAAACIAWALRILPRLWPMDEQFDGKLNPETLVDPERIIQKATLRPMEEIRAAADRVKLWHWRARQLDLERQGYPWPPAGATPAQVADLQSKGLDSFDRVVRTTVRLLKSAGTLDEIVDDDFVAKAKPYRELTQEELSELLSIASKRHKALNWLCGLAPNNDWEKVPLET